MLLASKCVRFSAHTKQSRRFDFECLERRDMLSGGPPKVTNVELASTSWDAAFVAYLQNAAMGERGYAIPVGSSAQSATLPWTNLNQIVLTFSEDVNIDVSDLSLTGVNVANYSFSDFHYDPQLHEATWTLSTPISKDRLRIDLNANGLNPVCDLEGNALDGEWINNSSTFASTGNGVAGGDFEFAFNVLPADTDKSGYIYPGDIYAINQLNGKYSTDAGYNPFRDLNGNGLINTSDAQAAWARIYDSLPGGTPAGAGNDAPTTGGFDLVQVTNAAVDVAIALSYGFEDSENGGGGLTYSIRSNSNPSLFDSVSINATTKELVFNAASGVSGRAEIVIRATDAGGVWTETVVTADVNYENAPPVLEWSCVQIEALSWLVFGQVSDADDDVSDFIVEFNGAFSTRCAVNELGEFYFVVIVHPDDWDNTWAVTSDPHGEESNEPFQYVGAT